MKVIIKMSILGEIFKNLPQLVVKYEDGGRNV